MIRLTAISLFLGVAFAATLSVNTTTDDYQGVGGNTLCSLREAINSAQENRDIGGCDRVRSGNYGNNDTIKLEGRTYKLTRGDGDSLLDQDKTDLDVLGQSVVIEGESASQTVVQWDFNDGERRWLEVRSGATLTLKRLKVDGSQTSASSQGGGVSRQSLFVPPASSLNGIKNSGTLTLENVVISGIDGLNQDGGAIANLGTLTIRSSRLENNSTDGNGGAIASAGTLIVEDSTLRGNAARDGGAILVEEGSATIRNSLLASNTATSGGGLFTQGGNTVVRHSTLSGNSASGDGGGIFRSGGTLRLFNATVALNTADSDQQGDNSGGGLFIRSTSTLELQNTLLAGNIDRSAAQPHPDCSGVLRSLGNNLVGDATGCTGTNANDTTGTGASPVDPLLDGLADLGGNTQVHALRSGSRAIDRGNNSACEDRDQLGRPRPTDGNGDGNTTCDIGAFEASALTTDLVVALVAPTNPITAGQEFNLHFSVSNRSANRATAAKVVLDVSLNPVLNTTRPLLPPIDCTRQANLSVVCELGNIPANSTNNYFVRFSAGFSPTGKTASISVSSATTESAPANNTNSLSFNIQPASGQASLAISGPASGGVEENLTYLLTARNLGPTTIGFTSVAVAVPLGTSFVADQSAGCRLNSTNTIICFKLNHAPGSDFTSRLVLRAPSTPTAIRVLGIMSVNINDTNLTDNQAEVTTQIVSPQADLELKLAAPSAVQVGREFVLRLDAKNLGSGLAREVTSSFSVPSRLVLQSDTSDECSLTASLLRCEFGNVPANQTVSRFVQFSTAFDPRTYNLQASVSGTVTDPNPTNNSASLSVVGQTAPPPTGTGANLEVVASSQALVHTTLEFSFRPVLDNDGPDPSTLPGFSFNLPSGMSYVSGPSACSVSGGRVSCNLSTLAPFSSSAFGMTLRAPSTPGTYPITLTSTQTNPDPNPANNTFVKDVVVQQRPAGADLEIVAGPAQSTAAGGALRYSFTVRNKGPNTAPDAVLHSALPEGAGFVSGSGCLLDQGLMVCGLGTLEVGASREIELNLTAPSRPALFLAPASVISSRVEWNSADNQTAILTSVGGASGSLGVTLGSTNPSAPQAKAGDLNTSALQIALSAGQEPVQLNSLSLSSLGSGNEAQDIAAVKVVLDVNANGQVDAEELVLASGKFASDNGSTTLTLETPLELPAGQSQNLLVVLDFSLTLAAMGAPLLVLGLVAWRRQRWVAGLCIALALLAACSPAVPGRSYTLSLTGVQATGSLSKQNIAPTGLPLQASPLEVRP